MGNPAARKRREDNTVLHNNITWLSVTDVKDNYQKSSYKYKSEVASTIILYVVNYNTIDHCYKHKLIKLGDPKRHRHVLLELPSLEVHETGLTELDTDTLHTGRHETLK